MKFCLQITCYRSARQHLETGLGDIALTQNIVPVLPEDWLTVIGHEFRKPYIRDLKAFLVQERLQHTVYPKGRDMFAAFWATPFSKVRVVILGQDPYHGPDQAHGLCFSVQRGQRLPPSLQNIFKELNRELGTPIPKHGDLTSWAQQGVLLLNTVLSVRAHQANSHRGKGWEELTDHVIRTVSTKGAPAIFVLWGSAAQKKRNLIDTNRHKILISPHPSPLSAHRGFFGCNHFSTINQLLEARAGQPIDWSLPN